MLELIIGSIAKLLDKIIPDPQAAAAAKLELLKAENQQILSETQAQLSAILAEAGSNDPWTSRARPSFLYVVYILLLASLPMGLVYASDPALAKNITDGFKAWLEAIPEPIIQLFGLGYLGYTGARSFEKWKALKK